ncbi:hypothetical protein DFJ73DRAFT_883537, partial [Zopfochytrium polystomum]
MPPALPLAAATSQAPQPPVPPDPQSAAGASTATVMTRSSSLVVVMEPSLSMGSASSASTISSNDPASLATSATNPSPIEAADTTSQGPVLTLSREPSSMFSMSSMSPSPSTTPNQPVAGAFPTQLAALSTTVVLILIAAVGIFIIASVAIIAACCIRKARRDFKLALDAATAAATAAGANKSAEVLLSQQPPVVGDSTIGQEHPDYSSRHPILESSSPLIPKPRGSFGYHQQRESGSLMDRRGMHRTIADETGTGASVPDIDTGFRSIPPPPTRTATPPIDARIARQVDSSSTVGYPPSISEWMSELESRPPTLDIRKTEYFQRIQSLYSPATAISTSRTEVVTGIAPSSIDLATLSQLILFHPLVRSVVSKQIPGPVSLLNKQVGGPSPQPPLPPVPPTSSDKALSQHGPLLPPTPKEQPTAPTAAVVTPQMSSSNRPRRPLPRPLLLPSPRSSIMEGTSSMNGTDRFNASSLGEPSVEDYRASVLSEVEKRANLRRRAEMLVLKDQRMWKIDRFLSDLDSDMLSPSVPPINQDVAPPTVSQFARQSDFNQRQNLDYEGDLDFDNKARKKVVSTLESMILGVDGDGSEESEEDVSDGEESGDSSNSDDGPPILTSLGPETNPRKGRRRFSRFVKATLSSISINSAPALTFTHAQRLNSVDQISRNALVNKKAVLASVSPQSFGDKPQITLRERIQRFLTEDTVSELKGMSPDQVKELLPEIARVLMQESRDSIDNKSPMSGNVSRESLTAVESQPRRSGMPSNVAARASPSHGAVPKTRTTFFNSQNRDPQSGAAKNPPGSSKLISPAVEKTRVSTDIDDIDTVYETISDGMSRRGTSMFADFEEAEDSPIPQQPAPNRPQHSQKLTEPQSYRRARVDDSEDTYARRSPDSSGRTDSDQPTRNNSRNTQAPGPLPAKLKKALAGRSATSPTEGAPSSRKTGPRTQHPFESTPTPPTPPRKTQKSPRNSPHPPAPLHSPPPPPPQDRPSNDPFRSSDSSLERFTSPPTSVVIPALFKPSPYHLQQNSQALAPRRPGRGRGRDKIQRVLSGPTVGSRKLSWDSNLDAEADNEGDQFLGERKEDFPTRESRFVDSAGAEPRISDEKVQRRIDRATEGGHSGSDSTAGRENKELGGPHQGATISNAHKLPQRRGGFQLVSSLPSPQLSLRDRFPPPPLQSQPSHR